MLELLLKYLLPCRHVPILHRHKINKIDPYSTAVEFFIDLSPEIMRLPTESMANQQMQPMSKTIGANWNHYGLHTGDSLYSNYHAYLCDARQRINVCKSACNNWANAYRYQKHPPNRRNDRSIELIKSLLAEMGYETNGGSNIDATIDKCTKQLDSLQSLGESSGYESLRYRFEEDESTPSTTNGSPPSEPSAFESIDSDGCVKRKYEVWKMSSRRADPVIVDFTEDLFTQGTVSLGKFSWNSTTQRERDVIVRVYFRSLFKCPSSETANLHQQWNLREFPFDRFDISTGMVSIAFDPLDSTASGYSDDV